jgi:HK97 family phage major capsid protein
MNVKEKVEKYKALYAQAKGLAESGDIENAEKVLKEADDLKAQAARELDIMDRAIKGQAEVHGLEQKSSPRSEPQPEKKTKFDSYDEWSQAMADFLTKGRADPRLNIWNDIGDAALPLYNEQKQMVENVGASGGFLVPVEQNTQVMNVVGELAIVRPRATIIRMNRRQYNTTVLDQTGTTAGQPHWYGGMIAYWGEEAAEKTLSTAKWREVSLVAKKLYGYTRASDELADDAIISLSDFLQSPTGMAGLIAWNEDYAFLQGNGTTQPLGVINAGATITINRQVAGPAADPVTYQDLTEMLEHHMETGNSIWVASISLKGTLMRMTFPTGNPSLVWQPSARDGMPDTILGRPVYWTEKVPLSGSAGDIGLYDFNHYWVGDRQTLTFASTNAEYFKYDQTSYRMVHRVDGRPWMNTPFTLQDGTSTISPFVILGSKST